MNNREIVNEFKQKLCYLYGYDKHLKYTGRPPESQVYSNIKESLGPRDFLEFAMEDSNTIEQNRSRVNCLSNCKRAIDSQINILVRRLGYLPLAKQKKWNIPKKIDFITDVGIIAPRILRRVNQLRNNLEHDFTPPSKLQVEDALDATTLFLAYAELVTPPSLNWSFLGKLTVKYDYDKMKFCFYKQDPSRIQEGEVEPIYTLTVDEEAFEDFYFFLVKTVPLMDMKRRLGQDI